MARAIVIGVGGGGRGVVNWLKWYLQQEYGSPEAAGVRLFCIDGPPRDQYRLAGDFQIDVSSGSPEFYPLTVSPQRAIEAITREEPFAFIDQWLPPSDARRIPTEALDPSTGFGRNRVAARAGLFLEAGTLVAQLPDLTGASYIFVVGSQSGGTGAGMLLDVAYLVKRAKGTAVLFGIVLLPSGFDYIFRLPEEVRDRDARAFAGLRELLRFQDASTTKPTRIEYIPSGQREARPAVRCLRPDRWPGWHPARGLSAA